MARNAALTLRLPDGIFVLTIVHAEKRENFAVRIILNAKAACLALTACVSNAAKPVSLAVLTVNVTAPWFAIKVNAIIAVIKTSLVVRRENHV
jgi:hypothetical protein